MRVPRHLLRIDGTLPLRGLVNVTSTTTFTLPRDIHPVVKWAGGKRLLAPRIIELMPAGQIVLHEPFVGGAAVFFELVKRKRIKKAFLSDVNADLMNAMVVIKRDVRGLISVLREHAARHSPTYYYSMRDAFNQSATNDVGQAARFIYLMKTCFNGLYRVNRNDEFNVPIGSYVNPTICDEENLHAAHAALQLAELRCAPFTLTMPSAEPGHVMYCDPPYLPVKKASKKDGVAATSFTAYDKLPFGITEHTSLATELARAAYRGVHIIASNSDMPVIRDMYEPWADIRTVQAPRAINRDGKGRGLVNELLITRTC